MKNIYNFIRLISCWGILQFQTASAQAQTGQAIDLDGVNDAVIIAAPETPMTEYTIQVRVLFKGSVANQGVILMTYNGSEFNWSHQIRTDASGHFEHALYDQGDPTHLAHGVQVIGTTVAVPNQWYDLTITAKNDGLARLYVNGVEEGNPQPVNVLWTNGTGFWVGTYGGNSSTPNSQVDYLNGQVDEVRIWNLQLGATEISQNRNCSISGSYPGLIRAYNFNIGVAGGDNYQLYYIPDVSGNNKNAISGGLTLDGPTSNFVAPAGTLSTVCSLSSVSLSGNASPIFAGSTVPSAANNTDFGVILPGSSSSKTYTLQNNGTATLHISSVSLAGAGASSFAITAQPATVLTPGSSTSLTVKFAPTSLGSRTATMHLVSDAAGAPDFSFALAGVGGSTLPVSLSRFDAAKKEKSVLLQWTTASETGTSTFVVERSANGIDFTELGRVAANGNSNTSKDYSFEDAQPFSGTNYYRLHMLDRDGQQSLSKVVSLRFANGGAAQVSVLPNPARDAAEVRIETGRAGALHFVLYNSMGQVADRYELRTDNGQAEFRLVRKGLPSGTYYYQVSGDAGLLGTGKLVFQ